MFTSSTTLARNFGRFGDLRIRLGVTALDWAGRVLETPALTGDDFRRSVPCHRQQNGLGVFLPLLCRFLP